ncbi:alpha/beta fold hydrolase [Nonomuraea sp. NPDC047529]|uniref:alpha/beta fold hydrolase n=1 Tax=Nonomuraea sp. NPDC047529 TaxID=3155623 RepID=UPI0033D22B26
MTAVQTFTPDRPGGAPPVLLLHGFASSGRQDWVETGIAAELAAAGRVVVVPDLPGHGESRVPAGPVGASEVAAALLALTGDGPLDVVGYSLGARLAWELPELAPDRVRAVVLGGLSPFEPFAALDVAALRSAVAGGEPGDPMTGMIASMIAGASGGDPERAAGLVRLVEGLRGTPFEPKGWAGRTPPVFVAGSQDMMTSGIENVVALVPGARLVTVPGDHRAALAGPEFRAAIAAALGTASDTASDTVLGT